MNPKPRIEGLSEGGLDSVQEGHGVRDAVEGQSSMPCDPGTLLFWRRREQGSQCSPYCSRNSNGRESSLNSRTCYSIPAHLHYPLLWMLIFLYDTAI